MFIRYRSHGFIFKKEDIGEANQLLSLYTKEFGRLKILGKGIRKISSKLRPAMELFYLSEIEFIEGKIYKTLTDAMALEKFKNFKKSLKKLSIAYKISDVLDNLIKEGERDIKIWNLILETFKNLNEIHYPFITCNLQYYYFFWNLISYLGLKPELSSCLLCQEKIQEKSIYFNSEEGGIICEDCSSKVKKGTKINSVLVRILKIIFEKKFNYFKNLSIEREDLKKLEKISEDYLKFLSEKKYETENI